MIRCFSISHLICLAVATLVAIPSSPGELPRLEADLVATEFTFQKQKSQKNLAVPYYTTSPDDLADGLAVGTLDAPGTAQAVAAFLANDKAGKFANLDSLLLWKDGKLVFEFYNRKGRVDAPHYSMSITKTMTSIVLGRAMQLGFLSMQDLDKPIIDLLPEIDRNRVAKGVETITLRESLQMTSGLRWENKATTRKLGELHQGDPKTYFQAILGASLPVTPEGKTYKYLGTDPSTVMAIVQARLEEPVQAFIQRELVEKLGTITCWEDQICGLPKCGAGSSWTTRSLVKVASMLLDDGSWKGEQILHPDYVALVLSEKQKEGYHYYFHNRTKTSAGHTLRFVSGVGAGGQYMSIFPEKNIILAAHSSNKGEINKPLEAALGHLIPLLLRE